MTVDSQAADDAQFEAGYSMEPTETPEPAKQPEAKQEEPKQEAKPDPVDPLKLVIDRLDKFEKGHTTLAGQFGRLQQSQKEIQDRLAAAAAATKTVSEAPTQAQVKEAMKNPDEWEALKDDFPQWATATEKFMDAKLATLSAPQALDPAAVDKAVEQRVAKETAAIREESTNSHLDAIVDGDWEEEVNTETFKKWFEAQTAEVKALADSNKLRDAARMMRLYEASKRAKPEVKPDPKPEPVKEPSAREKRFKAAVNPRGAGGHAPTSSDLDDFEAGYSGTT